MRITNNFNTQYVSNYKKITTQNKSFVNILQEKNAESQQTKSPAIIDPAYTKTTAKPNEPALVIDLTPFRNPIDGTYDFQAIREAYPTVVFIRAHPDDHTALTQYSPATESWVIAQPGDLFYGLSGDNLFAAITQKYNGGATTNPGASDMFAPLANMLKELSVNGLITDEELNAIFNAQSDAYSLAMANESNRLGLNFSWELFAANYRFSILDMLTIGLNDLSERVPSIAENKDLLQNFAEKFIVALS